MNIQRVSRREVEINRKAYKHKKRQAKGEVTSAKRSIWQEWKRDFNKPKKADLFTIAQQMEREKIWWEEKQKSK